MHWGRAIQAGDQGVILMAVEQEGQSRETPAPLHGECTDRWLPRPSG